MIKKTVAAFIAIILLHTALDAKITRECLIDTCVSHHIQFVEFCFTDFLGNRKSIIRPIEYLEDDLEHGVSFDGSSILGCTRITKSDMMLMPDLETPSRRIPWTYDHTSMVRVMCTMHSDKNTPYEADPRAILKRELDAVHALGYEFLIGPEIEFYVFNNHSDNNILIPVDNGTYADASNQIPLENSLITVLHVLSQLDLAVEKIHHEVGCGQFEISLERDNALKMADAIVTTKNALTVLCKSYNKKINFMPKPLTDKPGNGMHINFSLFDNNNLTNAFYDDNDSNKLSPLAQSFIAGVLKHVAEFTVLLNPTINSYKRLGGHEAPKYICCGARNRSALVRLPQSENHPETVRAEIRSPDPACNPYLAFAVILRAGMEGVKNNYKLPSIVSENLYTVDTHILEEQGITSLPQSLQEALTLFENSKFMREFLGDTLFFDFLTYKKEELANFNKTVTDWELNHYQ